MSYRHLPRPFDRLQRIAVSAVYLATVAFGVATLVLTPVTVAGAMGSTMVYVWASLSILGGTLGLWAAIKDKPHTELVAVPLAWGGNMGYFVAVWSLFINETSTRLPQALAVTILTLMWLSRAAHAYGVAYRGRLAAEERNAALGE